MIVENAIEGTLVAELRQSFQDGPIIDDNGTRFLTEEEVGRFKGLVISIFSDEHPPPHFCVRYQGETASFSITEGKRLAGNRGLEKFERNIQGWWKDNRARLMERWNANRPSDCPVGPITV
jgi:hypothetical protein